MCPRILFLQIVSVICRDQRNSCFLRESYQASCHLRTLIGPVMADLEVKIISKYRFVLISDLLSSSFVFLSKKVTDGTVDPTRKRDKTAATFCEYLVIESRFVM